MSSSADPFAAVPLPQAHVHFRSPIRSHNINLSTPYDFSQLAQTLLQIGSAEAPPAAERPSSTNGQSGHTNLTRPRQTLSQRSSIMPPASTSPPSAAPHESLPAGMQMLCNVAWNAVHSPLARKSEFEEKQSPRLRSARPSFSSPSRRASHFSTPILTPLTPLRAPVPLSVAFASPSQSRVQLLTEEEDEFSDDSSEAHTEPAEYEDVLNEEPERMRYSMSPAHLHPGKSPSPHANLLDLSRATQQQFSADWGQSPIRAATPQSAASQRSTSAFHDSASFSTLNQRTPVKTQTVARTRPAAFHVAPPNKQEEDEDEMKDVAAPAAATVTVAAPPAASTAVIPYVPRNLELEYEHLQQALHRLQLHYSDQLASEVQHRLQELDVALALAVGLEPAASTLSSLSRTGRPASGAAEEKYSSDLLEKSRAHATQAGVRALAEDLAAYHSKRLDSVRLVFSGLLEKHTTVHTKLREDLRAHEASMSEKLQKNHVIITKLRDQRTKDRKKAEEAIAAEEARQAKLKKEAEERAAAAAKAKVEAEAKAAADKAAASAAAKADADKAATAASAANAAKAAAAAGAPGPAAAPGAAPGAASSVSPAAQQEMSSCMSKLQDCRKAYANFIANPAMKQHKMTVMMTVNKQMAQIVGTQMQVRMKAQQLLDLLQQSQQVNTEMYAYCMETIAAKMVSFVKSKVRLQNSAAFPYAMVALHIAMKHPDFNDILLASLGEKCIYITPQYLDRKAYKDARTYQLALGYEEISPDDSKQQEGVAAAPYFEGEEQYFERMVGYVSFYGAYVQMLFQGHPHGIERGWVWLARVLNQAPRTATASIIHAFLSMAGKSLHQMYPTQTMKVLQFLYTDFVMRCPDTSPPRKAAQAVLALWLANTIQGVLQGSFPEPEGRQMPVQQESDVSVQEIHHGD